MTSTTQDVDVDGGAIRAHVRGEVSGGGAGPTVILLHYWGGSHRTWNPVLQQLDRSVPTIAYDHRGWGESRDLPGPFDLAQLADDAQRVIEALAPGDYVLVGHSMGGKVAQLVAARRPRGLTGVVLVAPAPPAPGPLTSADQDALGHAYDTAEAVNQSIDLVLARSGLPETLRAQVIEDSLSGSAAASREWPRHGIVGDIRDIVTTIEVPVLVLAGSDDRVEPPSLLATHLSPYLPTSTFTVLTDTGHLSPLEVPQQVATHLERFLASV